MRTRALILGLAALCFFVPAGVIFAADFNDVPATHPHAASIKSLREAGIVSGYPDGTFKPDTPVSRAEALGLFLKAAGIEVKPSAAKLPFTDVPETAWFYAAVQKGVALNKVKGYEDKTFRPLKDVTLPEAVTLGLAIFALDARATKVEPIIYSGLETDEWYSKPMQFAKDIFLIEPAANGRIDPARAVTRGEIAELLMRMRDYKQTRRPFDITREWITSEHQENFWRLRHPANWEVFKGTSNSVLWKPVGRQSLFTRSWPNGSRIVLTVADAAPFGDIAKSYVQEYSPLTVASSSRVLGGKRAITFSSLAARFSDTYIELENGKMLILAAEYGSGERSEFSRKQMELMIASYTFASPPPVPPKPVIPLERKLEMLREKILIEGGWAELKNIFEDKKLIHTDAIGVGTGPVDYFYSPEAGHTIKVERDSATVLNIKPAQAFDF